MNNDDGVKWGRIAVVVVGIALLSYIAPKFIFGLLPIVAILFLAAILLSVYFTTDLRQSSM